MMWKSGHSQRIPFVFENLKSNDIHNDNCERLVWHATYIVDQPVIPVSVQVLFISTQLYEDRAKWPMLKYFAVVFF